MYTRVESQDLRLGTQGWILSPGTKVWSNGLFPRLGLKVVYQGRVAIPKAGYPMFGSTFGSTGLVLRLCLEVGCRGMVPLMGPFPRLGPEMSDQENMASPI